MERGGRGVGLGRNKGWRWSSGGREEERNFWLGVYGRERDISVIGYDPRVWPGALVSGGW